MGEQEQHVSKILQVNQNLVSSEEKISRKAILKITSRGRNFVEKKLMTSLRRQSRKEQTGKIRSFSYEFQPITGQSEAKRFPNLVLTGRKIGNQPMGFQ